MNIIKFDIGITAQNLLMVRSGDDVIITIKDTGETLTVKDQYSDLINGYKISELHFDDDAVFDITGNLPIVGTENNDTLYGGIGDDTIIGLGGNDRINGNEGNDTLDGGAGNDMLFGFTGSDVYIFGRGSGNDTISDYTALNSTEINAIQFGAGIAQDDLEFSPSGVNLVVTIKDTGETLTIGNQFDRPENNNTPIGELRFADSSVIDMNDGLMLKGTIGNDYLTGTQRGDTFVGGAADDTLSGYAGNDVYRFGRGDGNDTAWDSTKTIGANIPDVNFIELTGGITSSDIRFTNPGTFSNLGIEIKDTGETITLENQFLKSNGDTFPFAEVRFDDGTSIDITKGLYFEGSAGADTIYGTKGNDSIDGLGGNDSLSGGIGNNTINGGSGDDVLNVNSNGLAYGGSGDDVLNVSSNSLAYGEEGNDIIKSSYGSNTITGGAGDDVIRSSGSNDVIRFGRGDSNDTIFGGSFNVIELTNGLSEADITIGNLGRDLVVTINDTGETITVKDQFYQANFGYEVSELHFDDGTVIDVTNQLVFIGTVGDDSLTGGGGNDTLEGLGGNDTITGDEGNDLIIGGTGNDALILGTGNDTYLFAAGDGNDVIKYNDFLMFDGYDIIEMTGAITLNDIVFRQVGSNYNGLEITFKNSTDSITIEKQFAPIQNQMISAIKFSDGTLFDLDGPLSINGTSSNDSLKADTIYGFDGDDTLNGTSADNLLDGGNGNDSLSGSTGFDTLFGGTGNDYMRAYSGIYIINAGDGNDTINANIDEIIEFGTGISFEDLSFSVLNNNALIISNGITGDSININNFRTHDAAGNSFTMKFADGTLIDLLDGFSITGTDINESIASFNGNDTITALGGNDYIESFNGNDFIFGGDGNDFLDGNEGDDFIKGGDGDDTLKGGAGNDTISGGKGDDKIYVSEGSDTFLFNRGDGNDVILEVSYGSSNVIELGAEITANYVSITRVRADLIITINDTGETITVRSQFSGTRYLVDKLIFNDGTIIDLTGGLVLNGTEGNDLLVGSVRPDIINGLGGNDTIIGSSEDDILDGGTGNDFVNGDTGNDFLDGGALLSGEIYL